MESHIGGSELVGLGDGGLASNPRGRNRLIGKSWRRFCSDRRSAWTAARLETHMVPIEMFCGRSCFENMVEQMGCPRNALGKLSKASCLDITGRCLQGLSCAVA